MRLYLLRHGQTESNVAKITQGWQDGKLTPEGERQARAAAERLKDEKIDLIIVSDLGRTRQTAQPIIDTHPEATVIFEPRVRERNQGIFEGQPNGAFVKHVKKLGVDIRTYQPPGGESIQQAHDRAVAFLEELFAREQGKTVLIISHGGIITQMLFYLLKKEHTRENHERLHPSNAALTLFAINDDGNHEAHFINSTDHL